MGLRHLERFRDSLLGKQVSKLDFKRENLWAYVVKQNYKIKSSSDIGRRRNSSSWIWTGISRATKVVTDRLRWTVVMAKALRCLNHAESRVLCYESLCMLKL